jgi:hypothetical protein
MGESHRALEYFGQRSTALPPRFRDIGQTAFKKGFNRLPIYGLNNCSHSSGHGFRHEYQSALILNSHHEFVDIDRLCGNFSLLMVVRHHAGKQTTDLGIAGLIPAWLRSRAMQLSSGLMLNPYHST